MPAIAVALVATLTAGGVAVAQAEDGAEPVARAAVLERLPELIAFVEQERGLPMRRAVDVQVLGEEEFLEALHRDDVEVAPGYDLGATFGAFGLSDAEEYDEQVQADVDASVVGFYDAVREQLVVRDDPLDPYLELVLVHELTHALQDQHFKVDRPALWDSTERALAFNSLVEGDAARVERAWFEAQPVRVRRQLEREVGGPDDWVDSGALLDPVQSAFAFPYVAGPRLVDALLEDGGQDALDTAFRHPPVTSEQVLHPELLAPGYASRFPRVPEREGEQVDEGMLGERGIALLLGVDPLEDGPQVGWDGDSYATYEGDGGELCTVAAVRMSSPQQRDALVQALSEVDIDATPEADAALVLESCG